MTDSDNDAFLVSSADENPDWVLDSGSAYHFCRDRKMFSTYAACEGLVRMANNTTNKVVGKGTVRFRMADGSIAAKGGILRISKGNKEMLREGRQKDYIDWRGMSRQEEMLSDMGPDVQRKVQRKENKVDSEELYIDRRDVTETRGARHLSEKVQALQSGSALPINEGKISRMQSCRSYGRAGSEVVRKDNLKTSDYPPMGWRGRLLDPAQVVRPKDPAQVVKPKPITHSSRIRMKWEKETEKRRWERKRGSDSFVRGGAERVEDGGAPSLLHGQQWRHE
ncbi:hypothetical protein Acr_27g0006390 [Actinidia rufa]|uniref:Retrovirus-related Pol polyprotein from transposon TNT 1-94-like beta-barrel domain-containing protein n=1 Tax=Actinidia rufa TaxID=165716 RepID=A0A7J0H724_9ERIC|nr:hypothetical protein Acr_27g0006390 [Actinidia rufa]